MTTVRCRSCLTTNATEYIDMESSLACSDMSYMQFFNQCTGLHVQLHDALPKTMCSTCSDELLAMYSFVQTACKADIELRRTHATKMVEETDVPEEVLQIVDRIEDDSEYVMECVLMDDDEEGLELETEEEQILEEAVIMDTHEIDIEMADNEIEEFLSCKPKLEAPTPPPATTPPRDEYYSEDELDDDYLIEYKEQATMSAEDQLKASGSKWRCSECKRVLHGDVSYVGHMNLHLNRRPYICAHCRCAFRCKYALQRHTAQRHAAADKTVPNLQAESAEEDGQSLNNDTKDYDAERNAQCELCKKWLRRRNLEKHMLGHQRKSSSTNNKFLCSYCPSELKNQKSLTQHERKHAGATPDVVYMCVDCDRQYNTQYLLEQHRKQAHKQRDHVCAICGNAFKLKNQLVNHMKLHLEKNIQCPHCEKRYARPFDLNVHLRSHTGELPYACHLCERRFAIKVRLTYHLQKHYGVKHRCRECGAEFNSKQKLKAHSYKHTGMPYRCEVCNHRGFANRDVFKRHLLRVHNTTMTDDDLVAMFQRNTGKTTRIREVHELEQSDQQDNKIVVDSPANNKNKNL